MEIRGLATAYGEAVVAWVKDIINGNINLPSNNTELSKELSAKF
jgi:hypothetical protein